MRYIVLVESAGGELLELDLWYQRGRTSLMVPGVDDVMLTNRLEWDPADKVRSIHRVEGKKRRAIAIHSDDPLAIVLREAMNGVTPKAPRARKSGGRSRL